MSIGNTIETLRAFNNSEVDIWTDPKFFRDKKKDIRQRDLEELQMS